MAMVCARTSSRSVAVWKGGREATEDGRGDGDLWSVPVPNRRLSACPAPDGLGVGRSSVRAGSKQNLSFNCLPTYSVLAIFIGTTFSYDLKLKDIAYLASVAPFIDIIAWCQLDMIRGMDEPRTPDAPDASATINKYARDFTSETE